MQNALNPAFVFFDFDIRIILAMFADVHFSRFYFDEAAHVADVADYDGADAGDARAILMPERDGVLSPCRRLLMLLRRRIDVYAIYATVTPRR